MRPQSFRRTANVELDATGYGYTSVTCPSGVVWSVERVSISTNAPTPTPASADAAAVVQPHATMYEGTEPNPAKFVEDTDNGNRDVSDTRHQLGGNESLCVEWVGTVDHAGLTATMTVAGMQAGA